MAVRLGTAAGLHNAATAEFLLDADGRFWFLEVNTRLQVEHGVTELVSGLDLVREQLWLAAGRSLSEAALRAGANATHPNGHAIEVRIAAEHPGLDFAPTPGTIRHWVMPSGPGVRVDTGVRAGDRVPPEYDNLIGKVMVHAADRDAAIDRLRRALDETLVGGIQTTVPFHRFVARSADFRAGNVSTDWVVDHWDGPVELAGGARRAKLAAGLEAISSGLAPASGTPRAEPADAAGAGEWRTAARASAVDRWPR
jgi:acetyl-CoA carboxylase biotin carboxylase subunit